jgi:hypothetical protein
MDEQTQNQFTRAGKGNLDRGEKTYKYIGVVPFLCKKWRVQIFD